jgi:hypothetical protein
MTRLTREEFEREVHAALTKKFGSGESAKLMKEYHSKIYTSYAVRIAPTTVAREIAKYERGGAFTDVWGKR